MQIRPAQATDAEALARLRWDFRAGMNAPAEAEADFVRRCSAWMAERLGRSGNWSCWVVESEARVRGQLWLQLIEKLPNPGPELEWHGYITNVYVDPDLRGSGAGQKLMEAALAHCRERGVDSVILWPTERSKTLYARHGFEPPEDMMELILDANRALD